MKPRRFDYVKMTTKHTPGPWHYAECQMGTPFVDTESVGDLFAVALPLDEERANVRLMAAAPDLLEALTTMMWCIDAGYTVIKNGEVRDAQTQLAVEAIRAAIAKAEGETK